MLAFIISATLKGAAVILAALVINRTILRRRSAASRHAVWSIALVSQFVLLLATPVMPAWNVPVLRAPSWMVGPVDASLITVATQGPAGGDVGGGAATAPDDTPSSAGELAARPFPGAASEPASMAPPARAGRGAGAADEAGKYSIGSVGVRVEMSLVLTLAWALGALLVLLRYVHGTAQVARLARSSERVVDGQWLSLAQRTALRMGIDRPLTLLRGERIGVPVTWGIVYPVVLLPEGADTWPPERREFVLLHEMAHVKRLDALTQAVAQLAEAVFWFNPFVWYAGQQSRLERERACDDYVLFHGTRPSFYADELLGMVRRIDARRDDAAAPAFAALAMARRSEFEGRMLAILDP
ncbi:MAG: hypothetical protein H0X64_08055, partial [Gemmatimonadaceae bacterium]|nr:hypothetical protein [Gemmatimonadaceae bacterium]